MRIILLLTIGLFIFSCNQDEPEPSRLSLLTNNSTKSWRVIEYIENGESKTLDCPSDDIWTFVLFDDAQNGQPSYRIEDNFISCESDDYIRESGIWRINNGQNRIVLSFSLGGANSQFIVNESAEILELSEDRLILVFNNEDELGTFVQQQEFQFIAI